MKALQIVLLLLLISNTTISQEEVNKNKNNRNPYKVKITGMNGRITRGYAYSLADDKITVFNPEAYSSDSKNILVENAGSIVEYPAYNIKKITFRQKNRFRNHLLGGILIGAVSGLIVGKIKSEGFEIPIGDFMVLDFTHPPVPVNYTKIVLHGATAGATLGAITGIASTSFILKGKKELFRENQQKMNKYVLSSQQIIAF